MGGYACFIKVIVVCVQCWGRSKIFQIVIKSILLNRLEFGSTNLVLMMVLNIGVNSLGSLPSISSRNAPRANCFHSRVRPWSRVIFELCHGR
ncbi:hypothetical protein Y032_0167g95 [Ancylostoma ceylanicum]|uniref:Uncharacterized protein n=1 Tax=Ancylostoma ceylanicum TaxID=53326 RepID=A0A016SWH3_9BILA|nr:hypothetical protein Y032_0167g95 [Ancylostoma ceylanicum]